MTIWKNTCGESWQDTIENGWEVSGKPGAFLFFIPKGALTHHLLKQAVVALPLVGHVRSPRGIAAPAGAAGQGCISAKLQPCPCSRRRGFRFWNPLFMGWYIATPSRRLPASTCHRQLDTDTGVERIVPPLLVVRRISRRTCCENGRRAAAFHSSPSERMSRRMAIYHLEAKDSQPWSWTLRRGCCGLSELFPDAQ